MPTDPVKFETAADSAGHLINLPFDLRQYFNPQGEASQVVDVRVHFCLDTAERQPS